MNSGAGIYFDGVTSTRRDVVVELAPDGLQISGRDGHSWGQWPYDEIEELAAPDSILRLGRRGNATLERLEIRDPEFPDAQEWRCRGGRGEECCRGQRALQFHRRAIGPRNGRRGRKFAGRPERVPRRRRGECL